MRDESRGWDEVADRRDFADRLTAARRAAGLSVRDVARKTALPASTLGGWFGGGHLPPVYLRDEFRRVLAVCGLSEPEQERCLRTWESLRELPAPGAAAPYPGLVSFQVEDADRFFGRDEFVASVFDRLRRSDRPLFVVGPSGCGKSSILRAGVLAGIRAGALAAGTGPAQIVTPANCPAPTLAALAEDPTAVVVIDQFEEIFTALAADERDEFVHVALTGPGRRVLALRADFYGAALRLPALAELLQGSQLLVPPMSDEQVRAAIVEPARRQRIALEDGLAELLIRDAVSERGRSTVDGALPLLGHALHATWKRARRGRMTVADYRACGGIAGSVGQSAEDAYAALDAPARELARRLMLRLVRIAPGAPDVRRTASRGELRLALGSAVAPVLDHFVERRLLTAIRPEESTREAGAEGEVQISHEVMLHAWPRLRRWIDEDRADLLRAQELTDATTVWRQSTADPNVLFRGSRLEVAEHLAATDHPGVGEAERDFVSASVAQRDTEAATARRRTRRLRALVAVLTVFVLAATALAALSVTQRLDAIRARNDAQSRQLAAEAKRLREVDAWLSRQFAVAAYRIAPTAQARTAVIQTSGDTDVTRLTGPRETTGVGAAPDGGVLAAGGSDGSVLWWRGADPVPRGRSAAHGPGPIVLDFSSDGTLAASGSVDGTVLLWTVEREHPERSRAVGVHRGGPVRAVRFLPGTRTLALGGDDGRVSFVDARDPLRPRPLGDVSVGTTVQAIDGTADGRTWAVGAADGTVSLWAADSLRAQGRADTDGRPVFSVAFSRDGTQVFTGQNSGQVRRFVRTANGLASRDTALSAGGRVNQLRLSADGSILAAAGSDNSLLLWAPDSGRVLGTFRHLSEVGSVAFAGAGQVVTGATDGAARRWNVPGPTLTGPSDRTFTVVEVPGRPGLLAVAGSAVIGLWDVTDQQHPRRIGPPLRAPDGSAPLGGAVAVHPSGRYLAAGDSNGAVWLWDLADPAAARLLPGPLRGPRQVSEALGFSPDGRLLAAGGDDTDVTLWDSRDPTAMRPVATLSEPVNNVYSTSFSPDGHTLAAGELDGRIWLWTLDGVAPPRPRPVIDVHGARISATAFSADGRTLAAATLEGQIRRWTVTDTGATPVGPEISGPLGPVVSLTYAGAPNLLTAASYDGNAWLWRLESGSDSAVREVATLDGGGRSMFAVTALADGRIAGGTRSGTVRLFRPDADADAASACATAGVAITEAEWIAVAPDVPFRPPCP